MSALKLREKVAMIAAHLLDVDVEALVIADGHITVKGSPGAGIEFAEVARVAYMDTVQLPEGVEAGLENTSRYTAPPGFRFSNATHACKCEVDVETGQVELLDYVVSEDCGIMINPMVVEGQVCGGVVQGIGQVLLEHMAYDSTGTPLTSTLKEYLLPTGDLIPTIRIGHIETPSVTPGGQKGMAEGGTIGAVAAVACAVADALAPLGVRVTDLSLGPDTILRLISEAEAPAGGQL
jgi:carbon-monoxide dehydrogenase large subunit